METTVNQIEIVIMYQCAVMQGCMHLLLLQIEKDHVPPDKRNPRKKRLVAQIMQEGLLEAGVPESQTALFKYGKKVIFEIFDACEPGDLLILLLGHVGKHLLPDYVRGYARRVS